MIASHLFLDRNQNELYNKSGIYSLYEHFTNTNNVNTKQLPITYIYENFKTNNLLKYPYLYSNTLNIFNNETVNYPVVGVNTDNEYGYLQFSFKPIKDTIISFLFFNANQTLDLPPIENYFNNFYSLSLDNNKIDNIMNLYTSTPEKYLYYYNNFNLTLYNNTGNNFHTIKIEFFSNYQNANLLSIISS